MRVLILGGTTEAAALARALAGRTDVEPTLSLAGRTLAPERPPIPVRIGGFGGADGLAAWLGAERTDLLIDATHPFAAQMSRHAVEAARRVGVPHLVFTRPPWRLGPGDRWTSVPDMAEAAAALGPTPRRVFLTVGRLLLAAFAAAPQHTYLIRTVDPPDGIEALPHRELIRARGPFDRHAEARLMRQQRIDILVTKNSGGGATYPKLEAARALGLPAIVVERPALPPGVTIWHDLPSVLAALEVHRPPP